MKCSGCGKSIPFSGQVCPFCQRDKSGDKKQFFWVSVFMLVGAGAGLLVHRDGWGLLGGTILGGGIAGAIWKPKKSVAPEVKPIVHTSNMVSAASSDGSKVQRRLADLEGLRKAGIVSAAEYAAKRQSILDSL